MAVSVVSEGATDTHPSGTKWVVDDDRNLVVLDEHKVAVAIYASGAWDRAEVTA